MARIQGLLCVWLAALLALAPGRVSAEIVYRVSTAPKGDALKVEMQFSVSTPTVDLQMPSWSPGLYVKEDYWKTMTGVTALDEAGNSLPVAHPRDDTWTITPGKSKRVTVRYERPVSRSGERLGMFSSDAKAIHYGGPAVYLYVVGRKQEPCRLEISAPRDWHVAVGLDPVRAIGPVHAYRATGYDQLADCPVTMGDFTEETYELDGKPYEVAIRGAGRDTLDKQRAVEMCRFISAYETDFFHGAPFSRYVWHIWANTGRDGAGGVEHASSSQIFLATGEGPGALEGMSHEFFHLWNVKRIRSRVLGPFDYTQLPKTGALWWLEGVTDYYADRLPFRYGAWGRERYLSDAARNVQEVRSNAARLEVSPYDASYRIPEAVNSFSSGYRVNYYPTGWTLGMLFDIELRARTNGQHSLDDVEMALWDLCKDGKAGFEEGEIRRQLVRFGGAEMGDLYDQWVMKPGELPVESELAKVGLQLVVPPAVESKPGRMSITERPDITPAQRALLDGWLEQKHVAGIDPPAFHN